VVDLLKNRESKKADAVQDTKANAALGAEKLIFYEIKVRWSSPAHEYYRFLTVGWNIPGMIHLAGNHDVTANFDSGRLVSQLDHYLALHDHDEFVMSMPVQVEVGPGRKQGVVGFAASDRIKAHARCTHTDRKTVAAARRAPFYVL